MVIKVMKWPLRQLLSKKYQVNLVLNRLDGLSTAESEESKLYVDLKWKGPKRALGSRFRSMKRDKTNALPVENSGCITWDKEFEHVCVLTNDKVGVFQPWHVYFVLCKVIIRMATIGFVLSVEKVDDLSFQSFAVQLNFALYASSRSYLWRAGKVSSKFISMSAHKLTCFTGVDCAGFARKL